MKLYDFYYIRRFKSDTIYLVSIEFIVFRVILNLINLFPYILRIIKGLINR